MLEEPADKRQRRLTIFGTVALLLFGTAIAGVVSYLILRADDSYATLLLVQLVCTILMFVPAAWFLLRRMQLVPTDEYSCMHRPRRINIIYGIIAIFSMLAMQPLVEWATFVNEQLCITFGVDNEELRAANNIVLAKIIDFSDAWKTMAAIFVIGIIPAVVEELFFRIAMQQYVRRTSGYASFSIISVAIVFSLFHGEIEAFIPRLLLGVLLGMLYEFTRTAFVPMLAHATNNIGVLIYCHIKTSDGQTSMFDILSEPTENPGATWPIISVIVIIVVAYCLDMLRRTWKSTTTDEK